MQQMKDVEGALLDPNGNPLSSIFYAINIEFHRLQHSCVPKSRAAQTYHNCVQRIWNRCDRSTFQGEKEALFTGMVANVAHWPCKLWLSYAPSAADQRLQ